MANTFTYFYFVLRLANPTGDALQSGLSLDDLLDAADSYNARFRGLKQLLILKTESVKVHIVLALGELHGFAFKRNQSNFVAHISAFSNFLLNERKWSLLSNDYRRLFSFLQDPLVCSEADVQATLIACGYTKAQAEQAKKSIQFVGPSEQSQYKWLLHAHHWLMMAQEYTERVQLATGAVTNAPAQGDGPAVESIAPETHEPQADVAVTAQSGLRKPANVVNRQYQQVAASTNPAGILEPARKADVATLVESPSQEPLPAPSLEDTASLELPLTSEPTHMLELIPTLEHPAEDLPTSDELLTSSESESEISPPPFEWEEPQVEPTYAHAISDEQMLAVLHSLMATRTLGDEQAVARKEEAIAAVKAAIAPWAYFG
jgi:hypothetical protein